MQEKIEERGPISPLEQVDDNVFVQAFIPRTLDEVVDAERDIFDAKGSRNDDQVWTFFSSPPPSLFYAYLFAMFYQTLYKRMRGLKADLSTREV